MAGPHEHRDGRGWFVRGVESVERDLEALRLKTRGWTLQQISDELAYGSRQNVARAIKRATAEVPMPGVEVYRRMQLESIDYAVRVVLEVIEADHPLVSQGGKVVHDDDGEILYDDGPRLAGVRELRALLERLAKVTGSDAPQQRVVTLDDLHAERARLLAEAAEYDEDEDEDLDDEADEFEDEDLEDEAELEDGEA
jgi:hypothetical protein